MSALITQCYYVREQHPCFPPSPLTTAAVKRQRPSPSHPHLDDATSPAVFVFVCLPASLPPHCWPHGSTTAAMNNPHPPRFLHFFYLPPYVDCRISSIFFLAGGATFHIAIVMIRTPTPLFGFPHSLTTRMIMTFFPNPPTTNGTATTTPMPIVGSPKPADSDYVFLWPWCPKRMTLSRSSSSFFTIVNSEHSMIASSLITLMLGWTLTLITSCGILSPPW